MASFTMVDCTTWMAGYDMTTDLNKMKVGLDAEDKENTTFGRGGWKSRLGGLKDVTLDLEGFWTGDVDAALFPDLGVEDRAVTVSPFGTEGSVAYLTQAGKFDLDFFGAIGEVTPFKVGCKGTHRHGMIRGQIAKAPGVVSGTGVVGSAVQVGQVAADRYLYAAVHALAAGTTITLKIESDDTAGFASPTDVTTLSPITAVGGVWMTRVAGPITDTYYRLSATAITGAFTLAAAIGVGA